MFLLTGLSTRVSTRLAAVAIATGSLLSPWAAQAADGATVLRASDRLHEKAWSQEKERLEAAMPAGQPRAAYRGVIEKLGYAITAINYDEPGYLEYEVVRGDATFEIRLVFQDAAPRATGVEVTTNLWRTEATEQAMRRPGLKVVYPTRTTREPARYSDRDRMDAWSGERKQIQAILGTDRPKGFYRQELEKAGYKVTAVNADRPDYLEYEVVRADNSFEVHIALDRRTQTAREVDVTSNVWKAKATGAALERR